MEGYIKLYRCLLDNPVVWKDAEHLAVWVYLLLNASHKELSVMFDGKKQILQPGQLLTGRKVISEKTKVSESKVQRILKLFENEQQIEQQTSNRNRVITIKNWALYQITEQQSEQQPNSNRTATEQQLNTNKNVKNERNIINKIVAPVGDNSSSDNVFSENSFEMQCVNSLVQSCLRQFPGAKVPKNEKEKQAWCVHIERMKRLDGRSEAEIREALDFAIADDFWKSNIRSTKKFREKFETLIVQSRNKGSRKRPVNGFNNFPQRDTNYDALMMEQVKGWISKDGI